MVDGFNPRSVWEPFGVFSMGVIQGDGKIVYCKGQVAPDGDGQVVGKGDMRAQVRKTLENIQAVLSGAGGTTRDIVSMTHYITDIEEFMKVGDTRREYFAEPFPVTTTVQIARLYGRELLVEISAIAEIPRERFKRPAETLRGMNEHD